jgi:hypothetical protein
MSKSPRLAELWPAIQTRLDTPDAKKIMVVGRTFRVTEDFASFRGQEGTAWGMQVVKGIRTLWPDREVSDVYRPLYFQVASYYNAPAGYDPSDPLEKLQDIAYQQLHGWVPPKETFKRVLVSFRIVRERPPQNMPDWDEDRMLWMLSSDYHTEVAGK